MVLTKKLRVFFKEVKSDFYLLLPANTFYAKIVIFYPYFIYSPGSTPNFFLKHCEKYFGVLNPTRYANSLMRMYGSLVRISAAVFRRIV